MKRRHWERVIPGLYRDPESGREIEHIVRPDTRSPGWYLFRERPPTVLGSFRTLREAKEAGR